MPKLNDDQRRALKTLAHQDGRAEAMLLADGISIDQLAGLVIEGRVTGEKLGSTLFGYQVKCRRPHRYGRAPRVGTQGGTKPVGSGRRTWLPACNTLGKSEMGGAQKPPKSRKAAISDKGAGAPCSRS